MHRNKSASQHDFAMVPRNDVPRSSFLMQKTYKTTFDAGYLVPFYCEEVLPGDTLRVDCTAFARLATPIFPVMDNLHLESFFFFVPNRLVWTNWVKFMGEQANPADSISYTVPQIPIASTTAVGTLPDYFGIPVTGQLTGTINVNTLPFRMYNLIFNTWFRDENLQNSLVVDVDDGPDSLTDYVLVRRCKRPDYFTVALPWTQKGGTAITIPIGTSATVKTSASELFTGAQAAMTLRGSGGSGPGLKPLWATAGNPATLQSSDGQNATGVITQTGAQANLYPTNLYADLSSATAATINQLRQSFQIQRFLEKDARGGTRYVEILLNHFGVRSPDFRLQRPEYLGGGRSMITINPIAQTSGTSASGTTTPLGNLAAMGTALHKAGYTYSATEHGYVIGLVNVHADLTYQQGLRRHWSRSTRYDYPWPVFMHLGEQAVYNKEIYCLGNGVTSDDLVFGYQERYGEMRYTPSEITGLFRSTAAGTIDPWHLSQRFTALPTLNTTFIQDTPPLSRILAVGAAANGQQLLLDAFIETRAARPMPMYSVPGLVDHF